jgi:hypothetical protein
MSSDARSPEVARVRVYPYVKKQVDNQTNKQTNKCDELRGQSDRDVIDIKTIQYEGVSCLTQKLNALDF